ncbi:pyridoxamine 5'-phosphate oxidase family protein [Amycolatopsis regifaucium]|uniref:Pyridoxamine 5'-phosphate oxidase n=1 Tax=Amycolatopsis regifaucium TaxID=546365 RepID=A0A154MQI9_9PSEU|nr:pyridoxamine 5'-phosphate oxidase family protein [Amycolatopsis regifaucium]KZB86203.1 pyridoxamine 5'-phosphate oxidase [Amycolatopsis regifaucium]OKA05093.1 pyridoxamine 5'-phosphate oxidase [Amycolatopsis regifaucium]
MSSMVMTAEEREAFLSEVHIGVLAVEREGRAPLAVPVWYDYEPGGELLIWMDGGSVKDKAIKKAGRLSLVAQTETLPYKYVTVEGPVVANDVPPTREQALKIAQRYLPGDEGAKYVDGALSDKSVLVRVRPEKWLSNDQSKA